MEKGRNRFLIGLSLIGTSLLLASCSASSASGSVSVHTTFTVNFFDDSSTPVQVGYAYCTYGEDMSHGFRNMNGSTYDWESHSDVDPDPGYKYVFSSWKGKYAAGTSDISSSSSVSLGGTDVDLSFVKGNCDVYASFSPTLLTFGVRYFGADGYIYEEEGDGQSVQVGAKKTYEWGKSPDYPSSKPIKEADWGKNNSFDGYSFRKGVKGSQTSVTKDFYYSDGNPSASSIYSFADDSLVSTPAFGALLQDTLNDDLYGYDGVWTELGSFIGTDKPIVTYYSSFTEAKVDFKVSFNYYPTKADQSAKTNLDVKTLNVGFGNALTFVGDTVSALDKDGVSHSLDLAPTSGTIKSWNGVFSDAENVPELYSGKAVDSNKIAADATYDALFA